jgi:hypothetical protein
VPKCRALLSKFEVRDINCRGQKYFLLKRILELSVSEYLSQTTKEESLKRESDKFKEVKYIFHRLIYKNKKILELIK